MARFTFYSVSTLSSVVDLKEVEGIQDEKSRKVVVKIGEITTPPNGQIEPAQLAIKITAGSPGQKGWLAASPSGAQVDQLVGDACNLGKEVVLYACPQAGENKLQFKLEAFYKGKLIDNKASVVNLDPFVTVNWTLRPPVLGLSIYVGLSEKGKTKEGDIIYAIDREGRIDIAVRQTGKDPVDLTKLQLKINKIPNPITGAGPGFLSKNLNGSEIMEFSGSDLKIGSLFQVYFYAQEKDKPTGFELTLWYNGKQAGKPIKLCWG